MKRKILSSVIFGLMFSLAVPITAAERPYYFGIGAGEADSDKFCDLPGGVSLVGSCDDTDTSWKIFGGYQFTEIWGAEVAYVDLGKFTASGNLTVPPDTLSFSDQEEVQTISLLGTARLPITDQFGVFGKVGAFYWDAEADFTADGVSGSEDDDGVDLTFGVGAQYDFTDRLGARIEWERFTNVGDEDESDIDLLSAGIVFWF